MKDSRAENYQSLTAEVNGVRIHYLESGTGKKPLVLIHGFGDTSWMWAPLFDEFGGDFTVIAPDVRGLGDSSRPVRRHRPPADGTASRGDQSRAEEIF